MQNFMTCPFEH